MGIEELLAEISKSFPLYGITEYVVLNNLVIQARKSS